MKSALSIIGGFNGVGITFRSVVSVYWIQALGDTMFVKAKLMVNLSNSVGGDVCR